MTRILLSILLASSVGGAMPPYRWQRAESKVGQGPDVKLLISDLWSPDHAVRISAKHRLVEAGAIAGPYLVSLIEGIRDHPKQHRFATGKEREGELYFQDPVADRDMARFVIDRRLVNDCVEILGDLRYPEAAPIIVRLLAEQEPVSLLETLGPEHYALVKIGGPAVLPLIDAIKNARSMAEAICGDGSDVSRLLLGDPELVAARIRQRAANVLRDIGDARAIPVLEDLLKPGQPFEHGNIYVEGALRTLRAKRPEAPDVVVSATTEGPAEGRIATMVRQLWSPDDLVRGAAKTALGNLGPVAEPYIVSLLGDIVDHFDDPHFATGKEMEGESYWRDPVGHVDFLDEFEITGRLALDCAELLGDMKSRDAVPIIVRLMEQESAFPGYEPRGQAAVALIKIGDPAVQPLIELLNSAPSIAASTCRERSQKLGDAGCSPDKLAERIRVRAVRALGAIGDARALPALEDLLQLEHGDPTVQNAIEMIRKRADH